MTTNEKEKQMPKVTQEALVDQINIDGRDWADAFVQHFYGKSVVHKSGPIDHDSEADVSEIHGWFANAIENGVRSMVGDEEVTISTGEAYEIKQWLEFFRSDSRAPATGSEGAQRVTRLIEALS